MPATPPFVVAIEPDPRQGAILTRIVRERLGAEIRLTENKDEALAAIDRRVPDLILVSALMSPGDEAELTDRLRGLDDAGHLQTLTIPLLATGPRAAPARKKGEKGGLFGKLRAGRPPAASPEGCDPAVFANQIRGYLDNARETREQAAARREDERDRTAAAAREPEIERPETDRDSAATLDEADLAPDAFAGPAVEPAHAGAYESEAGAVPAVVAEPLAEAEPGAVPAILAAPLADAPPAGFEAAEQVEPLAVEPSSERPPAADTAPFESGAPREAAGDLPLAAAPSLEWKPQDDIVGDPSLPDAPEVEPVEIEVPAMPGLRARIHAIVRGLASAAPRPAREAEPEPVAAHEPMTAAVGPAEPEPPAVVPPPESSPSALADDWVTFDPERRGAAAELLTKSTVSPVVPAIDLLTRARPPQMRPRSAERRVPRLAVQPATAARPPAAAPPPAVLPAIDAPPAALPAIDAPVAVAPPIAALPIVPSRVLSPIAPAQTARLPMAPLPFAPPPTARPPVVPPPTPLPIIPAQTARLPMAPLPVAPPPIALPSAAPPPVARPPVSPRTPAPREPAAAFSAARPRRPAPAAAAPPRRAGLAPLAMWAYADAAAAPRAAARAAADDGADLRALVRGLELPPGVADVSYPTGCSIRRVRVRRVKASKSKRARKAAGSERVLILSRRRLEELRGVSAPRRSPAGAPSAPRTAGH